MPTQTAVEIDGVNPTIQASLFCPSTDDCTVPVLAPTGRPPASGSPEWSATCSIDSVTLRASCWDMRCSPAGAPASNSTRPSAVVTRLTRCGRRYTPSAANVP